MPKVSDYDFYYGMNPDEFTKAEFANELVLNNLKKTFMYTRVIYKNIYHIYFYTILTRVYINDFS